MQIHKKIIILIFSRHLFYLYLDYSHSVHTLKEATIFCSLSELIIIYLLVLTNN
jgi:hypothetical protein